MNCNGKIGRSSKVTVMQAIYLYQNILQNLAYAVTILPPMQMSMEELFFFTAH